MADLTYRAFEPGDAAAMHAIVSHWSVVRQLGTWPWPPDPVFTANRCRPYDGDGFVWAICCNDELIGSIGVTNGDIGYNLSPDVQGQGIGSQAARDAVAHAFATSDRDHLTGSVWHDNIASAKVLRRLGFEHYATRYRHARARGLPTLCLTHRLTRDIWDRLSQPAQ